MLVIPRPIPNLDIEPPAYRHDGVEAGRPDAMGSEVPISLMLLPAMGVE